MSRYDGVQDLEFRKSIFSGTIYCREYETKQGDTLGTVAFTQLGSSSLWWALAIVNNISDPFIYFNSPLPKVLLIPNKGDIGVL